MVKKVVINKQFGGFGMTIEAWLFVFHRMGVNAHIVTDEDGDEFLCEGKPSEGENVDAFIASNLLDVDEIKRDSLELVEVVERMGPRAAGKHCKLKIVEIPEDVEFCIQEYGGLEHIAEKHRTWS